MSKRGRTPEKEPARGAGAPRPMAGRLEELCEAVIEAGWLVALAAVPLFFNVYSARSYEPDKTVLLRTIVVVMVSAWLWKVVAGGRAWRLTGERGDKPASESRIDLRHGLRALAGQPFVALTLLLALLLVLGSLLSIDPRLSWHGSYPRFQGAWAQLSYLALFALTAAHFRTRSQWQRIVLASILGSVPVALYAVLQAAGLDPVPHDVGAERAFSTLGNPIFLGAYLLFVIFITLNELGRLSARWWLRRTLASAAYTLTFLLVLLLQLGALVLTQSRGPFLGLLAGGYVYALLLALVARARAARETTGSRAALVLRRWAWAVVVGAGLFGAGFLVVFNLPGSPLSPLRAVPYLGRLGSILDFSSNTAQVRLLIWDGALELLASGEPLAGAGVPPDRLEPVRTAIGYGPETLALAMNRHIKPELGQREGRRDIPDRAHNETLDVLVMNGAVAYAVWLAIYCTAFLAALARLGLVRSRPQRISFWINLGLGALLGALAPYVLLGNWTLAGVGLPAGLVTGLVVFVTLEALIGARSALAQARPWETGILVAVLAAVVAHVVEIHFGIAIVSTRLYFWLLLAILAVHARGWLTDDEPETAAVQRERLNQRVSGDGRRGATSGFVEPTPAPGLVAGALGAVVGVSLIYGLLLNSERTDGVLAVIAANAWRDSAAGAAGLGALPWLLAATLLATAVLAASLGPATAARRLRASRTAVGVAGAVMMLYALLHTGLLAHLARLQAAGADPLETTRVGTSAFSGLVGAILLLLLALGLVLGRRRGDLRSWSRRPTGLVLVVGLAVGGAAVWVIDANLDPIRADSLLKQARAFVAAGRPDAGLRLLDEACELAPREPVYFLFRGQAALRAAAAAKQPVDETRFLAAAETTLLRARALAPLDPDHSANLARLAVRRAGSVEQQPAREELLQRAAEEYRTALALRPSSVLFMNELAPVLLQANELDEAEKVLGEARALDDRYALTFFNLATVRQTRAAAASGARDLRSFVDWCERAIAMYELALVLDPGLERAAMELERLRAALASVPHRAMTGERLAELYGDNVELHLGLARARLDEGLAERAAEHARLALELGDADQAAAARAVLAEARASARRERD